MSKHDDEPLGQRFLHSILEGFGFALGAFLAGLLVSGAVFGFLNAVGSSLVQHRP